MKKTVCSLLAACLFLPPACGAAAEGKDLVYTVSKAKVRPGSETAGISIETLTVRRAASLEGSAVTKINASLAALSRRFHADGLACHDAGDDGPWGYEVTFDGYVRSKDFLTVIFKTFAVCGGSPNMAKTGATFAVATGRLVPPREILERLAPGLLADGATIDHGLLRLGEDAGAKFIDDHADQFPADLASQCDWYIKQTGFKVWPTADRVVLHPEFQQPYSVCYKDYFEPIPSAR